GRGLPGWRGSTGGGCATLARAPGCPGVSADATGSESTAGTATGAWEADGAGSCRAVSGLAAGVGSVGILPAKKRPAPIARAPKNASRIRPRRVLRGGGDESAAPIWVEPLAPVRPVVGSSRFAASAARSSCPESVTRGGGRPDDTGPITPRASDGGTA